MVVFSESVYAFLLPCRRHGCESRRQRSPLASSICVDFFALCYACLLLITLLIVYTMLVILCGCSTTVSIQVFQTWDESSILSTRTKVKRDPERSLFTLVWEI